MIKPLENIVDFIVCDSPLLLLGLFYNRYNKTNVSNIEKTEEMILNEFTNIYIFLERNPENPFTQQGRLQNEKECKEVGIDMKKLLEEFNLPYLSIMSSKNNIPQIIDYINKNINK